jgi:iron complex transport system substrate-binding protein
MRPSITSLVGLRPAAALLLIYVAAGCRHSAAPTHAESPARWPRTYSDELGNEVTLTEAPGRIVSVSPAMTEMLFAVGAGDRVVGVTSYCTYPPEVEGLPEVGSYTGLNVEKVVSLRPDLVIGMRGNSRDSLDGLKRAGLNVLAYDPISVADVINLMEQVGQMAQESPGNIPVVDELRGRVDAVTEAAAKLPRRPRTLCAVQVEPLYAAGPDNHVDDMIRLAGGENLAADAKIAWPQYSLERMVEKDPEVIVCPSGHINGAEQTPASALEQFRQSEAWAATTAVKRGAVLAIPDDLLTLPGPRLVDGLERMAEAIAEAARTGENADAEAADD